MEDDLWIFINFEQDNWARLLPIAEFAYNHARNASCSNIPLNLTATICFMPLMKKTLSLAFG